MHDGHTALGGSDPTTAYNVGISMTSLWPYSCWCGESASPWRQMCFTLNYISFFKYELITNYAGTLATSHAFVRETMQGRNSYAMHP